MKKSFRHFPLLVSFFLIFVSACANSETIMGSPSCGQWLAYKKDPVVNASNTSWLLGYISGIALGLKKDFLADIDVNQVSIWMDNYCRDNLLQKVSAAGIVLSLELVKRKGLE